MTTLKIATRKSPLALVQANQVRDLLLAAHPGITVELLPLVTSGDKTERPLTDIGGKGLFTKEIEEALLDGRADIAVHSVKDMMTVLPEGLVIGCTLPREDARDMLVGEGLAGISDIPQGASFGTSSLRRAAQLLAIRPDIKIVPLRGNVETRLAKLKKGDMRATMLAAAGIKRLGLTVPGAILPPEKILPAVGQGAIAVECKQGDYKTRDLLSPLHHQPTHIAIICERAFLKALDGSCRTPIAGFAEVNGSAIQFRGMRLSPDGKAVHAMEAKGNIKDAELLGMDAGEKLKSRV